MRFPKPTTTIREHGDAGAWESGASGDVCVYMLTTMYYFVSK